MAVAMTLALAVSGCVQPATKVAGPVAALPLRVSNNGSPFGADQGIAARKLGEAECAAEGRVLRTSIYDRFESGEWVFVEGCA
ncbi:hypothetical protein ACSBLW_02800 [Thioclava sp. FR2]|uniref:hypothetical protein n=1 Tax=Thioclava sp. FR2 TaxID=3445780 RepID=UPI003EB8A130